MSDEWAGLGQKEVARRPPQQEARAVARLGLLSLFLASLVAWLRKLGAFAVNAANRYAPYPTEEKGWQASGMQLH